MPPASPPPSDANAFHPRTQLLFQPSVLPLPPLCSASCLLLLYSRRPPPVVRLSIAKRAAELMLFLEDPLNFEMLASVFNRSSRYAKLQGIKCYLAGKNLYMRFRSNTGDAMGMNMVSKGVQNVLDCIQIHFPDMDVISISGNFCIDKKPAAVNWIESRGKLVVCEAIIKDEAVNKVLKTSVPVLVELNVSKNLTRSAMAGALGGFNAHASNIVTAIYIATSQDPAFREKLASLILASNIMDAKASSEMCRH